MKENWLKPNLNVSFKNFLWQKLTCEVWQFYVYLIKYSVFYLCNFLPSVWSPFVLKLNCKCQRYFPCMDWFGSVLGKHCHLFQTWVQTIPISLVLWWVLEKTCKVELHTYFMTKLDFLFSLPCHWIELITFYMQNILGTLKFHLSMCSSEVFAQFARSSVAISLSNPVWPGNIPCKQLTQATLLQLSEWVFTSLSKW